MFCGFREFWDLALFGLLPAPVADSPSPVSAASLPAPVRDSFDSSDVKLAPLDPLELNDPWLPSVSERAAPATGSSPAEFESDPTTRDMAPAMREKQMSPVAMPTTTGCSSSHAKISARSGIRPGTASTDPSASRTAKGASCSSSVRSMS